MLRGNFMMQFGKILELTQLNLVQPAAQGYTSAINETKGSNKKVHTKAAR